MNDARLEVRGCYSLGDNGDQLSKRIQEISAVPFALTLAEVVGET